MRELLNLVIEVDESVHFSSKLISDIEDSKE